MDYNLDITLPYGYLFPLCQKQKAMFLLWTALLEAWRRPFLSSLLVNFTFGIVICVYAYPTLLDQDCFPRRTELGLLIVATAPVTGLHKYIGNLCSKSVNLFLTERKVMSAFHAEALFI